MSITRVITDIPRERVPFVKAMVAFDNGKIFEERPEDDGEVTLVAEFPDVAAPKADAAPIPIAPTARAAAIEPGWMALARRELGVAEAAGPADNPRIVAFHATTHGGAGHDSVPWCSSFVNFCVTGAGFVGTNSKAARSWMTWGRDARDFVPGCIVVLERGAPPKGHVGFFVGTESGRIRLLGGNQSDRVSIASFDAALVLARRIAP